MSRLFLFLAALPCLLAAPAVAEPIRLMCDDGWPRFTVDPEERTVIQHGKDGDAGFLEIVEWEGDAIRVVNPTQRPHEHSYWFIIDIDLGENHVVFNLEERNKWRSHRSAYDCAEVASFPPVAIPPPPIPEELTAQAEAQARFAAREAAERARWWGFTLREIKDFALFIGLPLALVLTALGFAVRDDLKARRRVRRKA